MLKYCKCNFFIIEIGTLINYVNVVHILSPKVNDFWCDFGSYIGSFVCKEQRFIQVTSYKESYKNKENRNLSQSSRKARRKSCSKQEQETLNSGALWQLECSLWEPRQLWRDLSASLLAWLHLLIQHPLPTCLGVLWCFHFCLYHQRAPSPHALGSNPISEGGLVSLGISVIVRLDSHVIPSQKPLNALELGA